MNDAEREMTVEAVAAGPAGEDPRKVGEGTVLYEVAGGTLRESSERFRLLFERSPEATFLSDPHDPEVELRIIECNDAAARQNGYTRAELVGQPMRVLEPEVENPLSPRKLVKQLRQQAEVRFEARVRRKDGSTQFVETALVLVEVEGRELVLSVHHDLTERRRLEEQLRQAQKMEAIGRLTGGVAHDFNNMLAVISGYSELLLLEAPPGSPLAERLGEIRKASDRAAELTRQLLLFSRGREVSLQPVSLNDLVHDVTRMLKRLIGEDLDLTIDCAPGLGQIRADAGQIQQVLLNLAVNARDAMPRGGSLTIQTRRIEVEEYLRRQLPGIAAGPHVLLIVSDTGVGMDAATRERIFEPFFTTKEGGKGTGLGLATVYRIVEQSGGHIHVYSETGQGTVFRLYFPLLEAPPLVPTGSGSSEKPQGGTETILVVEDEPMLREMVRSILQGLGYRVLVAPTPTEAPQLCASYEGPIHLLLTDLVMPGLSGREVADLVREIRPETRVLFMSGYSNDTAFRPGIRSRDQSVLEKPFRPEQLALRIRKELDRPAAISEAVRHTGTVLLIDDDAATRESIAELLELEGFHAVLAREGREALNYLQANPAPDLILLDLRMPGMNGWVFRTEQQKSPTLAAIPTVVLSGADDPGAVAAFLGTTEFLAKPVDVEPFLALVRRYCGGVAPPE